MADADRRGAAALSVIGLAGVAASLAYLIAFVREDTLSSTLALGGLSLGLAVAGALRRWRGRTLPGAAERLLAQQEAPGAIVNGVARLFAFVVDGAVLAALALGAYQLFRFVDADPMSIYACTDVRLPGLTGLAFLRLHWHCFATHGGLDELGGGIAALACSLYLLAPAAAWSATPGLLLIGRVWVRSDGNRLGAVHAVVRALTGFLLAPMQALFTTLRFFNFATRWRNVVTGEKITVVGWGILSIARRPRTLADLLCRTEAIPRSMRQANALPQSAQN
jgi:RDD family